MKGTGSYGSLLHANQERGRARLPDPELNFVEFQTSNLKDFQARTRIVDPGISQVGKAGLPPLFVRCAFMAFVPSARNVHSRKHSPKIGFVGSEFLAPYEGKVLFRLGALDIWLLSVPRVIAVTEP